MSIKIVALNPFFSTFLAIKHYYFVLYRLAFNIKYRGYFNNW